MRINGNRADHDCNTATAMSPPHHRLEVGRRYHDDRRPSDRLGNPGGNTQQKLQKQPSTSTQASPKQLERQVTCGDAHFGPGRGIDPHRRTCTATRRSPVFKMRHCRQRSGRRCLCTWSSSPYQGSLEPLEASVGTPRQPQMHRTAMRSNACSTTSSIFGKPARARTSRPTAIPGSPHVPVSLDHA